MSATPVIKRSYTVIVPGPYEPIIALFVVGVGDINAVEEAVVLTFMQYPEEEEATPLSLQRHLPAGSSETPTTLNCNIVGGPCVENDIGDLLFGLNQIKFSTDMGYGYLEELFVSV